MKLAFDSLLTHKYVGLVVYTVGLWWWMFSAMTNTKGAPYRGW